MSQLVRQLGPPKAYPLPGEITTLISSISFDVYQLLSDLQETMSQEKVLLSAALDIFGDLKGKWSNVL
eukprot:CAMPEP_0201481330 /NCGR_PEP_ID=MMETSP0151_2-20130828/5608_1 /ASSEMBLY_ACC=CAM_ASM_000257 /TAXON_ID=200890 /ORGANISM="Paramoeba atlantica, Strain 621/1 / CCAP 1560/9" /LENGTH=67 /DNA_ID=CAMNT_0047863469 /DNA_START=11 /DNA_END=211 /DNA_ORIENTATION=-